MVYRHAVVAAFRIYAQRGFMLLKGEVGGRALNSHGNNIVDHGKSWKNHGILFLNFCGNPDMSCTMRQSGNFGIILENLAKSYIIHVIFQISKAFEP